MLLTEIEKAQRLVRTDAYQMSIGEIVSMYETKEIVIDPEFQRLFRWDIGQKSKLIESLLLGIPLPSIFVFETESGSWELIDGLQRLSTILEFMGKLKTKEGAVPPSVLEATKYLPSLHNVVWEISTAIDLPVSEQVQLEKNLQLTVRRARISVEILKRPSDTQTKFDLFQRLNAGGTQANAQELRNCIMLMINPRYFRTVKRAADNKSFRKLLGITSEQADRQRHMELAVRFLVLSQIDYDGRLDIEEYIDDGIVKLAQAGNTAPAEALITDTFGLLYNSLGKDGLRKFDGGRFVGKIGLVALEGIAVGIAKNLRRIQRLSNPEAFVKTKVEAFWQSTKIEAFTSPGLRGTTRIQRTIPFGQTWFKP